MATTDSIDDIYWLFSGKSNPMESYFDAIISIWFPFQFWHHSFCVLPIQSCLYYFHAKNHYPVLLLRVELFSALYPISLLYYYVSVVVSQRLFDNLIHTEQLSISLGECIYHWPARTAELDRRPRSPSKPGP